jgi:hypothetical protein
VFRTPTPDKAPVYRISTNVQRFESAPGQYALIDAVWSVRSGRQPASADLPQRRRTRRRRLRRDWSPATAVPSPAATTSPKQCAHWLPAQNPVADSMEDWSR